MPADRFAAGHSLIKPISSPVLANVHGWFMEWDKAGYDRYA